MKLLEIYSCALFSGEVYQFTVYQRHSSELVLFSCYTRDMLEDVSLNINIICSSRDHLHFLSNQGRVRAALFHISSQLEE